MRERLTFEREIQDLDIEGESPSSTPMMLTKEPLAVPPPDEKSAVLLKRCKWNIAPSDPVPFADIPPMGSYWPIITSHSEGRKVAYVASDGKCNGVHQRGRQFLADRIGKRDNKETPRWHVGVDLFANENDKVVACERGKIIEFKEFYPSKKGEMTYKLLIEHPNVVINYGEVKKNLAKHPIEERELKKDDKVEASQVIGFVSSTNMLHFETYKKGTTKSHQWWKDEKRPPSELLNPTKYLLFLQEHGQIGPSGKMQPIPPGSNAAQDITSLPLPIQMALRAGNLTLEVALAILSGNRDVNDLTNRVFYALYPKWRDKKLKSDDPEAKVWIRIRDVIRNLLGKVTMGPVSSASPPSATLMSEDDKLFKWHPPTEERRYGGYSRYGGGRVDKRLKELSVSGQVLISDADIDMLQRIANVESRGMIQCINSYDSAFMSMGFMQWTIKYNDKYSPDGKLQRLIQRAPKAFRRYGIELVGPRRYHIKTKSGTYTPLAIKGAEKPSDLRSLEWAKRFYAAGLDPDIIVEEVNLALEVIKEDKKRIIDRVGSTFLPHYEKSAILRALIQETFNNRPAYLYLALQRAIARAKKIDEINTDQFLELTRKTIKEVYTEKEPKKGPKKAENLINKTERLTL